MHTLRITCGIILLAFLAGCGDEVLAPSDVLAPSAGSSLSEAPTEQPFLLVVDDVNPCTGEAITIRYEGTSRVQQVDDHRVLHIVGTVTTSDGWTGIFNRQLVFHGADVSTRRFFDMQVGPEHQRVLFTSNIHLTVVDGEVKVQVLHPQLRCIGKPSE